MKKTDEVALWNLFRAAAGERPYRSVRIVELADHLDFPPKRADYIISKWARRGLVEYGTSIRTIWLTPEGAETEFEYIK